MRCSWQMHSRSPSHSPSPSPSPTPCRSRSPCHRASPSTSPSRRRSPSLRVRPSPSHRPSPSRSPTASPCPSPSPSPSLSHRRSPSPSPSPTPAPTPSHHRFHMAMPLFHMGNSRVMTSPPVKTFSAPPVPASRHPCTRGKSLKPPVVRRIFMGIPFIWVDQRSPPPVLFLSRYAAAPQLRNYLLLPRETLGR